MAAKHRRLGLLAAGVGFFSAGIGIGGGAILVPALVHLGKFDFRKASSLSLATIAPISLIGAATHAMLLKEHLPVGILAAFLVAGAIGVLLGSLLVKRLPTPGFTIAFALFLLVVGLKMTTGWQLAGMSIKAMGAGLNAHAYLAVAGFGVAVGITSSLLGVGCGLIIVPFCVYALGLNIHVAITFSLIAMFFLTSGGAWGRHREGLLDGAAASKMIPAALVGAVLGAIVSSQLPELVLRQAFGIFLLVLGTKNLIEEIARVVTERTGGLRYAKADD